MKAGEKERRKLPSLEKAAELIWCSVEDYCKISIDKRETLQQQSQLQQNGKLIKKVTQLQKEFKKKVVSLHEEILENNWAIKGIEYVITMTCTEVTDQVQAAVKECLSCQTNEQKLQEALKEFTQERKKAQEKISILEEKITLAETHKVTLNAQNQELAKEVYIDELTQLANRKKFNKDLDEKIQQWNKFSIALIDLDHFKKINDKYGHSIWDHVLHFIATRLSQELNIYRRWGEEFVVIEDISTEELAEKIWQLKRQISNKILKNRKNNNESFNVTFTAAITEYQNSMSADTLFNKCDADLYRGKQTRDIIIVSDK